MISEAYGRDCNSCAHHLQGAHPSQVVILGTGETCADCLKTPFLANYKGVKTPVKVEEIVAPSNGAKSVSPSETQVGGSHYKGFKIQPWHFCMVNGLDFATSSVIKYVCRKKGDKAKQIEDLKKAVHNIEMKIEMLEKEET